LKRRRQFHAIGAGVQTRAEVHHHVHACLDFASDQLIEKICPYDPGGFVRFIRKRPCNFEAARTGQSGGEGIAEQGVGPFGLADAKYGRPPGGIGNVLKDRSRRCH